MMGNVHSQYTGTPFLRKVLGSSSLYSTAHIFHDCVTQLEMQVMDGTTSSANRNHALKMPMPIRMLITAEPAPYSSRGPRKKGKWCKNAHRDGKNQFVVGYYGSQCRTEVGHDGNRCMLEETQHEQHDDQATDVANGSFRSGIEDAHESSVGFHMSGSQEGGNGSQE